MEDWCLNDFYMTSTFRRVRQPRVRFPQRPPLYKANVSVPKVAVVLSERTEEPIDYLKLLKATALEVSSQLIPWRPQCIPES
jgi:hypothetical protein